MKPFDTLEAIYGWHEDIAQSLGRWACEPGCSDCCTALVTLTSLEAAFMIHKGRVPIREGFRDWPDQRTLPRMGLTANERARLCISGRNFDEHPPPSVDTACPVLVEGRCSRYEARPLMCRMMLSSIKCSETGYAEMPPTLLSFTTVCQQLVEDIDRQGWSGYLIHMLPLFEDPGLAANYPAGHDRVDTRLLRRNRPNPEFLVPQEDRPQIRLWLKELDERLKQN